MLNLLRLNNVDILEQLKIEEALLRVDSRNWCIINTGSSRAIVMGVSGKKEELVDLSKIREDGVPLIRRFSGGGTVIVDESTVFVTFICQKDLHDFPPYPEHILEWSTGFYFEAFGLPEFVLQENDYALGKLKCGGNAQYLRKDRWLHHTTFLWDFKNENMDYLLYPKKTPKYREGRSHLDFLCRLNSYFPSKEELISRIVQSLEKSYRVIYADLEEVKTIALKEHRKTTELVK